MDHTNILVLYYSKQGNTLSMALSVAKGIEQVDGCQATLRTVPELFDVRQSHDGQAVPNEHAVYVTPDDFHKADGLVMGSPTRFGNMAAPLKHAIDQTSMLWVSGVMAGKPAGLFTSTGSIHGGQETTLLSMMLPLLHHGMLIVGLPYTHPALMHTTTGGTPYGASHLAGSDADRDMDADELALTQALGQRVAKIAKALKIN